MGNSKFNVSDASSRLSFPDFLRAQNMVRVTEGKVTYIEMIWGEKNYFELAGGSSYRG